MDADRKKVTWRHLYSHIYKSQIWIFWKYIDFNEKNLIGKNQASIIKADFVNENACKEIEFIRKYSDIFTMSGDADFTVESSCNMHAFKNFSLMPCTGGLNNAKGQKRFTDFLKMIDQYFTDKKIDPLFRSMGPKYIDEKKQEEVTQRKRQCLIDYFELFEGIYDYCKKIYLIDNEEFIRKLLGSNINADEYRELMFEYWEIREKAYRNLIPIEEQKWMEIDINNISAEQDKNDQFPDIMDN